MRIYKRSLFSLVKGLIITPCTGVLVFIIAQIFIPPWPSAVLGVLAAAALLYMTVFSEDIYFELDDDGAFRYFKRRREQCAFALPSCRTGYQRKTEWGLFGNNDIKLKILDAEGEETEIDASPLGTSRFDEMFAAMEQFAIRDVETITAEKKA